MSDVSGGSAAHARASWSIDDVSSGATELVQIRSGIDEIRSGVELVQIRSGVGTNPQMSECKSAAELMQIRSGVSAYPQRS